MATALLCQGWPRGLGAAVRHAEAAGRSPALLLLPADTATRWQRGRAATADRPALTVLPVPDEDLAAGVLAGGVRRALRAARIDELLVFRNDGGHLDLGTAAWIALRIGVRRLLVLRDGALERYDRRALLRLVARDTGRHLRERLGERLRERPGGTGAEKAPAPELFDPVAGRFLPRGGEFAGVDARGGLDVSPLGFLRVPGMPEPSSLEPTGRTRVVMLGGSALYGLGLGSNGTTIPAGLYRRLVDAGSDCEVLSFAVPGGWSRGESAMLLYRLRYAEPDIVVSLSGWNDFNTLFAMELVNGPGADVVNWTFSDHHHYLRVHAPHEIDSTGVPFSHKPSVRRNLAQLDSSAFPESGERIRRTLWLDNQALMAAACERHGIRFVCALQPHSLLQTTVDRGFTRDWVESHYDFAFADRVRSAGSLFDGYARTIESVYTTYRSGLARLADRFPSATFLDLSDALADEPAPGFLDGVHPTQTGAAVLADRLADTVLAHLGTTRTTGADRQGTGPGTPPRGERRAEQTAR
ncbi:hypothetical protein [Kitasatospora purpeofusca]|uniref:hypothetical protein n=1 Tax=Kitasatospora purpeofusca TaxID=67352 RepID=UPI0036D437FB